MPNPPKVPSGTTTRRFASTDGAPARSIVAAPALDARIVAAPALDTRIVPAPAVDARIVAAPALDARIVAAPAANTDRLRIVDAPSLTSSSDADPSLVAALRAVLEPPRRDANPHAGDPPRTNAASGQVARGEPLHTRAIGTEAELRAAALLVEHGYHIVEQNFRVKAGEIDIVAYRAHPRFVKSPKHERRAHPLARYARMLCFIEVRSRADDEHGGALLAFGYHKRKQVSRVAAHYLNIRNPDYEEIRFDVVAITGPTSLLIEDAFRAER